MREGVVELRHVHLHAGALEYTKQHLNRSFTLGDVHRRTLRNAQIRGRLCMDWCMDGVAPSPDGVVATPPGGRWVCRASAVMIAWVFSTLHSTRSCSMTTPVPASSAPSRCARRSPSVRAPRAPLPSTAITTGTPGTAPARTASQALTLSPVRRCRRLAGPADRGLRRRGASPERVGHAPRVRGHVPTPRSPRTARPRPGPRRQRWPGSW